MRKRTTVTLRTIAEATGFSINTVSRALKEMPDISEKTRTLIQKKAREMGYIGDALASSMRSGLTNTIAVILSDIANPHFAIIVKDIVEHLREHNYTAFIMATNEDEGMEQQALKAALSRRVDGIILCPTQRSDENIEFLIQSGIPFVLIGRYFPQYDTNYVICNDRMGGYQAAKHLINLGHKEILMLNGESFISSSKDRLSGYEQAMEEAGLPVQEELIHNIPVLGNFASSLDMIFNKPIHFTAIIAFSDMLAWELMDYLESRGIKVPKEMSVIAFDDLHSRYVMPFKLSSITSSKGKMSYSAVDILIKKIAEPLNKEKEKVILSTKIIQRNSCAEPREHPLPLYHTPTLTDSGNVLPPSITL